MADKVEQNVPGPYYVTDDCVACGLCIDTAPENFKFTDNESFAYVCKQPENDEETAACEEAIDDCPASAIEKE